MKQLYLYALLAVFIVSCNSDDDDYDYTDEQSNFSETGSYQANFSASSPQQITSFEIDGVPINSGSRLVDVTITETSADVVNDIRVEVEDVEGLFTFVFSGFTVDEETIILQECTQCFNSSDDDISGTLLLDYTNREIGLIISFDGSGGTANDQVVIEIIEN